MPDAPASARPGDVDTDWLLRRDGNPVAVLAHQDDETVFAGAIRRMCGDGRRGKFIWWTNGDGLAPEAGVDPGDYAKTRIAEAAESLRRLGVGDDRKIDLETSEIENYRRLTHVAHGGARADDAIEYFLNQADRVERALCDADPDRVFVLAWQGGHPEHDLVHAMTARAVRRLRAESGEPLPVVQVPAYEYVIACAMRFKPWFKGDRRRIHLTDEEMDVKRSVFDAYPSQQRLMQSFRTMLELAGTLSALRGHRVSVERYLSVEELGVVDPDLDHTRSTHHLERLNYMFDDFEGEPIRFDQMVRPVVAALEHA